jgi:MarR family 2-MHQ and catechol resistance regulon transcriptional repressor
VKRDLRVKSSRGGTVSIPVPAPIPDSRALKLWVVLSRAFNAVERHARADFNRIGLSPSEFGALEVLYHKGPLPLGALQKKILVSSGGMTFVVDRLAAKGLVERRSSATDRRSSEVTLTEAGAVWMSEVFPRHQQVLEHALSALPECEIDDLIEGLKQVGRGAANLAVSPPSLESGTSSRAE